MVSDVHLETRTTSNLNSNWRLIAPKAVACCSGTWQGDGPLQRGATPENNGQVQYNTVLGRLHNLLQATALSDYLRAAEQFDSVVC